jgi:hypothetical protein
MGGLKKHWEHSGEKPLPARDQSSHSLCVLFIVHYPSFLKQSFFFFLFMK